MKIAHIPPIYKLPTEILTFIFNLVSVDRCLRLTPVNNGNPTQYPHCLTRVCSHWHEVALSSPSLWTHIDLTPDISNKGGSIDRARAYAERAGNMPLEIHLDDKGRVGDHDLHNFELVFQSLAYRMEELDFVMNAPQFLKFHGSVLTCLFSNLSPKRFKRLHMSSIVPLRLPFLSGCDSIGLDGRERLANILEVGNGAIDGGCAGVTSLHLQGIFFLWSHKLYHGLVDLRLTSSPIGQVPLIPTKTLIGILSNSPGLRIFYFSLNLQIPSVSHRWSPVPLPDLEVIQVSTTRTWTSAASLFRLLKPGSKPLRLTLEASSCEPLLGNGGMNNFFARSKVGRLCIRGEVYMNDLQLCDLPDLKVLVFDSCHYIKVDAVLTLPPRWKSCLVYATTLYPHQVHAMTKLCPTGLVFSKCEVRRRRRGQEEREPVISEKVLQATFPTAQFLTGQNSPEGPTAGWDILD